MRYLIFLAIVVHALALPSSKHGNLGPDSPGGHHGPERPLLSRPSAPNDVHPVDHHNGTGLPPHYNPSLGTRPPPPDKLNHPHRHPRYARNVLGSAPHKARNSPPHSDDQAAKIARPTGGSPYATGKPLFNGALQTKPQKPERPTPKRHDSDVKGAGSHPTRVPHLEDHTHESNASRPPKSSHPEIGTKMIPDAGKKHEKNHSEKKQRSG